MIIMLCGPIGAWWGHPREGTIEHRRYLAFREDLSRALVAEGHLVYHPHRAFSGAWYPPNARAQAVNDAILLVADAVFDMTPPNVPSPGTEHEVRLAKERGVPVFSTPPLPLPLAYGGPEWYELLARYASLVPPDPDGQAFMRASFTDLYPDEEAL